MLTAHKVCVSCQAFGVSAVNDFRFNYFVHDIMQKTGAMDMVALLPVMMGCLGAKAAHLCV